MKELVKTIVVALVLAIAAVVVFGTRGSGTLDMSKFNIDLSSSDEEFSYPVASSELNGQYEKSTMNSTYLLVGKNDDGTYRVYFIKTTGHIKNIILRLDSLTLNDSNVGVFTNEMGNRMKIEFTGKQAIVGADVNSVGDKTISGQYYFRHSISTFSLKELNFTSTKTVNY